MRKTLALFAAFSLVLAVALPTIAKSERETVSYECQNGTRIAFTSAANVETLDAATDAACDVLDGYTPAPVLTCFDASGMVTTGDDWKECLPVVPSTF